MTTRRTLKDVGETKNPNEIYSLIVTKKNEYSPTPERDYFWTRDAGLGGAVFVSGGRITEITGGRRYRSETSTMIK